MSYPIRQPRYGGTFAFYPNQEPFLTDFIHSIHHLPSKQIDGKGLIVPHAGYQYSGKTLYRTLKAQKSFPKTIILIGPNHTGLGSDASIMCEGTWQIMKHSVPIHSTIAKQILAQSKVLRDEGFAHEKEHSLEVILPLLLTLQPEIEIIPIILKNYQLPIIKNISEAIINTFNAIQESFLVIASSDMSHYVSKEEANRKDRIAFQAIQNLNEEALLASVLQYRISMCGSGPVAIALQVAKSQGATQADLIDYTDSSEETKDPSEVVSYAGFILH